MHPHRNGRKELLEEQSSSTAGIDEVWYPYIEYSAWERKDGTDVHQVWLKETDTPRENLDIELPVNWIRRDKRELSLHNSELVM